MRRGPEAQIGQRNPVQDTGRLVPDLFEYHPDVAGRHVLAFGARHVRGLTRASDQRQRTVEQANHLTDADVAGWPVQRISAPAPTAAAQQTVMRLRENELKELTRDPFLRRERPATTARPSPSRASETSAFNAYFVFVTASWYASKASAYSAMEQHPFRAGDPMTARSMYAWLQGRAGEGTKSPLEATCRMFYM